MAPASYGTRSEFWHPEQKRVLFEPSPTPMPV